MEVGVGITASQVHGDDDGEEERGREVEGEDEVTLVELQQKTIDLLGNELLKPQEQTDHCKCSVCLETLRLTLPILGAATSV